MRVLLKGGPCDDQTLTLADLEVQYSTRVAGQWVIYDDTGEIDQASGRHIFALRPPKPAAGATSTAARDADDRRK